MAHAEAILKRRVRTWRRRPPWPASNGDREDGTMFAETTTKTAGHDAERHSARHSVRRAFSRLLILCAVLVAALGGAGQASATAGDGPFCTWEGGGNMNIIGLELPTGDWPYGTRFTIYLMRWDGAQWRYDRQAATATWYGQWETWTTTNVVQVYPRYHGYYRIMTRLVSGGIDSGARFATHYQKSGPGWYSTGTSCHY
jgi:hypothetical protein